MVAMTTMSCVSTVSTVTAVVSMLCVALGSGTVAVLGVVGRPAAWVVA